MSQGVRKTHQTRSKLTRDKLLSALEKLLQKKDFADITTAEIAKEAGVSAASIYRRFDKKQGFIQVLFDLYIARIEEWAASPEARPNLEDVTLKGALEQIALVAWDQLTDQRHIMRAVALHGRQHLSLVSESATRFEAMTLASMEAVLDLYKNEVKRADIKRTAKMLAYFLNNIFIERCMFEGQFAAFSNDLSKEEFCREVALFAYGYLILED